MDYPPLAALSRLFSVPPYRVAPDHCCLSPQATLAISPVLDELLRLILDDYRQLPLLAPLAVQYAAIGLSLASHRFVPFAPPREALHHFHGLMLGRVLSNRWRDPSSTHRSSREHFTSASRHMDLLRDRLSFPASSPHELQLVQQNLTDLGVYLAFALHGSTTRSLPARVTSACAGDLP